MIPMETAAWRVWGGELWFCCFVVGVMQFEIETVNLLRELAWEMDDLEVRYIPRARSLAQQMETLALDAAGAGK